MKDVDIRRLLGSLPPSVKAKTFFIESPAVSQPTRERLSKFGSLYTIGMAGLSSQLGQIKLKVEKISQIALPPVLEEMQFINQKKSHISSVDIDRLLVGGSLNTAKLSQADIDGDASSYIIARSKGKLSRACNFSNKVPVLVHGSIGNGKTIFARIVGYQHSLYGYRVFELKSEPEDVSGILSFFNTISDKCLIIVDDIARFPKLIARILDIDRDDIRVLLTARSSYFEVARHSIDQRIGKRSIIEIDLNLNSPKEISNIITFLDTNGLFGHRADLSAESKRKYVSDDCGGQLRDLVLSLYEDGHLHNKVIDLLDGVRTLERSIYELTALGALLTVMGFSEFGRLHVASELSNYSGSFEVVRDSYYQRELQGLIRIDSGEISFGSPAFAEFMLSKVIGVDEVLSLAQRALFQIDRDFYDDTDFDNLTRGFLKFSTYSRIFRGRDIDAVMDRFYDDCRALKVARRDPLFLVQRSISNMAAGRFDISEKFVSTAYAMAKHRPNYDPYQIETHEATLLLTMSIKGGISQNLNREQKALALLTGVLRRRRDDLYHPLSTLRLYAEIAQKWGAAIPISDKRKLDNIITDALQRLVGVPSHVRQRFSNLRFVEQTLKNAIK